MAIGLVLGRIYLLGIRFLDAIRQHLPVARVTRVLDLNHRVPKPGPD